MSNDVIPDWTGFPPEPDVNGWHWGLFPGGKTPAPAYWESVNSYLASSLFNHRGSEVLIVTTTPHPDWPQGLLSNA